MELLKGLGVAVILLTISACSTEISEPEVIKKVNAYVENKEYREAVITLKDYIKSHPEAFETRVLAGDVYLDSGDYWSAEKEYSRALENGASEVSLTPKIAKALFYKGDHEDLLHLSIASLQAEGKATVLAYQGLSLTLRQDFEAANERLKDALKYKEDSDFVLATMAKVKVLRGEEGKARELIDQALGLNSQCHYCWSVLGDIEFSKGNYDKASVDYSKAIDFGSDFSQDYFKRALSLIYLDDSDKAKTDLSRLNRIYGESSETEFAYGLIEYRQKDFQEAASHFDKSLKQRADYPLAIFYMAVTQYALENYERAEFFGSKVVSSNKDNLSANSLMASILDKQGRYSEAANYLSNQYQKSPELMVYYANLLVRSGRTSEAIDVLSEIATANPDSPEIMANLGTLMLSAGDQTGVEKLKTALELDADYYYADSVLAVNHLQNQEYTKAIEAANRIKESHPELSLPHGILGRVYMAMGDTDKAWNEYSVGCELTPGDTDTCLSYGALAAQQGDMTTATEAYDSVIKAHPELAQGYVSLSAIHASQSDFEKFTEVLERGIKNSADPMPRLVLARYYLASNQANKVFPLFQAVERQNTQSVGVYDVLAKAYLQTQNFQMARLNIEKLIALDPKSAEAWYLMSVADAGLRNSSGAEKSLEKSIRLDPDYYPARLALSKAAIFTGDLDAAKKHFQSMSVNNPDSEETLKVKASIESMSGDNSAALETYKAIFSENASFMNMVFLTQHYWNMGERDSALKLRESWAEEHRDSIEAQMALADVYTSLDANDKAVTQYRRIIDLDRNHLVALNNLAWLLKDTSPKEALSYSEQAYKINPESLHVLDTMALVLVNNGDYNRAKRTIERVVGKAPDNLTFKYHSALVDTGGGNNESAKRTLANLVELDFPEKNAAKDLLKSISQ